MTALRQIPLQCVDDLNQVRDELEVVWLALGNTADCHVDGAPPAIREHVNGLQRRLTAICKAMEGGAK